MHQISQTFINQLQTGILQPILQAVHEDKDLDLYIRENYINIYYKGNALLKLTYHTDSSYKLKIDPKFSAHPAYTAISDIETSRLITHQIPHIKENIIRHGKRSLEIEYEQLIIRANNREARTNPEYFIVDRQYALGKERLDLTGVYWNRAGRQRPTIITPSLHRACSK